MSKVFFNGCLSILQDTTKVTSSISAQSWFTRFGNTITTSEVYLYQGRVVAFQDCLNGEQQPLFMDLMFKELYKDEPELYSILKHAGVLDLDKVETFSTGR